MTIRMFIIYLSVNLAFGEGRIKLIEEGVVNKSQIEFKVYKFPKSCLKKESLQFQISKTGDLIFDKFKIKNLSSNEVVIFGKNQKVDDWFEKTEKGQVDIIVENGIKIYSHKEGSNVCTECVPIIQVSSKKMAIIRPGRDGNSLIKTWLFFIYDNDEVFQIPISKVSWKGFWEFGWSYAGLAACVEVSGTVFIITTNGYAIVIKSLEEDASQSKTLQYGELKKIPIHLRKFINNQAIKN